VEWLNDGEREQNGTEDKSILEGYVQPINEKDQATQHIIELLQTFP
jgi:hypothetical protein